MILVSVKYLYLLSCSKLFLTSQKDPSYVAIHVSSDGSMYLLGAIYEVETLETFDS